MIIILIGPMGCGKTTIGQLLAMRLNWPFYDGDDFHPQTNVQKMRRGVPLADRDRLPWLERIREGIIQWEKEGKNTVLACSALKKIYRQALGIDQKTIRSVYLKGSYELIRDRLKNRNHPFMDDNLLKGQIETMEEPEDGLAVDISMSPEDIVEHIIGNFLPDQSKG